jgi:subtilisin family serine protease
MTGAAGVEPLEGRLLLAGEPWSAAAKLIGQDLAVANYPDLTGAGQTVVVIDSGVDYKHPTLGGGIGEGFKVVAGHDFQGKDDDPFPDTLAHGTGTAGVIAAEPFVVNGTRNRGIAPGVKLIALRQANSSQVKASLRWVIENRERYNVTAISLLDYGGPDPSIYAVEFKELVAAGVFFARPAGNRGPDVPASAGVDEGDYVVGAVDTGGRVSAFSQRGPELDLLAPGEKMGVVYYDIKARSHVHWISGGTSWSAPAAVATAALIRHVDPTTTPAQVMRIMQDSGASVYDAETDRTYRRLNVHEAIKLAYARRDGGGEETPTTPPAEQTPFGDTPVRLGSGATTIQAEAFDDGGEGVAYHDVDSANTGGDAYRAGAGVDVRTLPGGRRDVTAFRAGEWIEYTVDVATAGAYSMAARIASATGGGRFHVEVDGVDRTGALNVPKTGSSRTFRTVGKAGVALAAGRHVVRVSADAAGPDRFVGNLDAQTFTFTTPPPPAPPTIPAPRYARQRGVRRSSDHITGLAHGDWVGYDAIDFGPGVTQFKALIAAPKGWAGGRIEVRVGSPKGRVIGTLTVKRTRSWDAFRWQTVNVKAIAGVRDIYLTFAGTGGVGNVRAIAFA